MQNIITKLKTGRFETLGPEIWLLSSTVLLGAMNYLSHSLVGRLLGPADYGIFATLNSFSLVWGVVTGAIQAIVANNVARMAVRSDLSSVGDFLVHAIRRTLPWGGCCAIALIILSNPIATSLQISSTLSIVVISSQLIPISILPVAMGGLRGLQRFGQFGGTQIIMGLLRLLTAVGLITGGLGITGAIASLPVSSLGAFIVGTFFLRDVLSQRESNSRPRIRGTVSHSVLTVVALGCFAVLTNSDVIFAKMSFSPEEAGFYSAVATIGKTILWISGALVTLLLPRAAVQHAREERNSTVLIRSLMSVTLLCGGASIFLFIFKVSIMRTFFGEQYLSQAQLLGTYGAAMVIYSFVNVWLFYYLAVHDDRYPYLLLLVTTIFLVSLLLYGDSMQKAIFLMVLSGLILCLAGGGLYLARGGQNGN